MLVGLKINESVLNELADKKGVLPSMMLMEIANWFKVHHEGVFAIGRDSKYCQQPHFHIHFETTANENAVKAQKSKKIKELQDNGFETGGRTTKLYIPKDIEGASPFVFLAYSCKEEIVYAPKVYLDNPEFNTQRLARLEVKKLSYVKSQMLTEKTKEKKEFKEEMFEYIKEKSKYFEDEHDNELYYVAMVEYLIKQEKYGSLKMCFLKTWFLEYSSKYLGKIPKEIFKLIR